MKVSKQREKNMYAAISEPITNLRIKRLRSLHGSNNLDDELFNLETVIWKRMCAALGMEP